MPLVPRPVHTRRMFHAALLGMAAAGLVSSLASFAPSAWAAPAGQDWPQWRGARRDGVWRETGLLETLPAELPVKWRAKIANGYSGPTVAQGRVYITDRVTEPEQQERIHCLDWETGKPLWSHAYACLYKGVSYPNGPRAAVTVADGRAYALGSMANLHCLDAATGKVLWNKDLYTEYQVRMPDWGIAAAPLIEGELVIVMVGGSPEACLIAFDRKTGKEVWKALKDGASYSAPAVFDHAGKRMMVCRTAERIVGLDPATGKLYWEIAHPSLQNVDGITTPVLENGLLYFSSVYEGSLALRLGKDTLTAEKVWEFNPRNADDKKGMKTLLSTPVLKGGHVYGIDYFGELRCLDAETGDRKWEEKSIVPRANWASAHLIEQGERTWIFNERGQLILSQLSPAGYKELGRAQLISPTRGQLNQRGGVAWSHPAFAYGHIIARNDEELVCVDLRAKP